MSIVLAALGSDASAQPVLSTAIALAALFDATVVGLHVREDGAGIPESWRAPPGSSCARSAAPRSSRSWPPPRTQTSPRSSSARAECTEARNPPATPRSRSSPACQSRSPSSHPTHTPPEQIARILVPLEGTSESSQALEDTIKLAHRRRLEILVLHVHSPATVPAFSDHDPHATTGMGA